MAFNGSSLQHPRERLRLPAISVLDTKSEVNFQSGRFFVTEIEFESIVNILTFHYWKIQVFCTFARSNFEMLINWGFVCGDLRVYGDFLRAFLEKDMLDPKGMFEKVSSQFPLEFLLMFDLFRDHACYNFNVSML